jgi:transposase
MSDQKKPPRYTTEFRQSAVKLAVESDEPISRTAKELGVNENTLHTRISKYHTAAKAVATADGGEHFHAEPKRLRKENKRLREEREILKKAADRMRPTPLPRKAYHGLGLRGSLENDGTSTIGQNLKRLLANQEIRRQVGVMQDKVLRYARSEQPEQVIGQTLTNRGSAVVQSIVKASERSAPICSAVDLRISS